MVKTNILPERLCLLLRRGHNCIFITSAADGRLSQHGVAQSFYTRCRKQVAIFLVLSASLKKEITARLNCRNQSEHLQLLSFFHSRQKCVVFLERKDQMRRFFLPVIKAIRGAIIVKTVPKQCVRVCVCVLLPVIEDMK